MMKRISRNPRACYGCRACELMCSFHKLGAFSPSGGAISVRKDNSTGEIEWTIGSSCDLCKGEEGPLCVKYCSYKALSLAGKQG
ncbi:MAG: hypothetical protein JRJ29_09945 [Deltaproteobacteria bacterium]|nr:hypothetical protein [Deltaproteobacteria bacterium]